MTLPASKDFTDAAKGSLLGLAIGDALGAPVEFHPRGTFELVKDFRPAEQFGLQAGQWTDDTSQAVCLATALVRDQGYDSWTVMDEYVAWWLDGRHSPTGHCFDIGIQTRETLKLYKWSDGIVEADAPRGTAAGNGVIMRLAPAAIVGASGPQAAADALIGLSARDTHYSLEAEEAAVAFGRILLAALTGLRKDQLLSHLGGLNDSYGLHAYLKAVTPDTNVRGAGYVRESLQAAWWSFLTTDSFEACVLTAVNLGDDADTTGAIAGQLAGAYYGMGGIPAHWLANLWAAGELEQLAEDLLTVPCRVLRSRFQADELFAPRHED